MTVKKILIATDGSGHAAKAVELGSEIASKFDAEVVLVHVLLRGPLSEDLRRLAEVEYQAAEGGKPLQEAIASVPEAPFTAANLMPKEAQTTERVLQAVAERILAAAERTARGNGVSKISTQIEDGDPATCILHIAKDAGVDMIFTGARGLSGLKALMVGSVSHKLTNLAKVTCVTVR